jgi:hypothetical protein
MSTHVPYVLQRALHRGESPRVAIRCDRRGAHEVHAPSVSALGAWTALLSRGATLRAVNQTDVPLHCWLAVTERSLIVVTTAPWQRDRRFNRRISLLRVTSAAMLSPEDGHAAARIELMDHHLIEVEVPRSEAQALLAVVAAIQAAISPQTSTRA